MRLTRPSLYSAAAACFLLLPISARADGYANEQQLAEMTAVLQKFTHAIAAKDGKNAAALMWNEFVDPLVLTRNVALDSTDAQLKAQKLSIPDVMRFRMYFTADELIGKTGRELYAMLVDRGLDATPEGAKSMSNAIVSKAFVIDGAEPARALGDITLGERTTRRTVTFTREAGALHLTGRPVALMFSEYLPGCVWRSPAASHVDQKPDPACVEEMKAAERPIDEYITAGMKGGQPANDEYDRLHQSEAFEALMRHPYNPQYWQPMRATAAH